jgi:hypothetical protein
MVWAASRRSLTRLGISAAALVPESRQAKVVDVPTFTISLPGHWFEGGEQVELASAGAGSALPTGTSAILAYLTKLLPSNSSNLFTITNLDGSPVTIADAGVGVLTVLIDLGPTVDAILAAESSLVVARAKAHRGPWTSAPPWAEAMAVDLAGPRIAKLLRVASSTYKIEDLMTFRSQALAQLEKMADGEPMDDGVGPVDATPTAPDNAPRARGCAPAGFGRRTL